MTAAVHIADALALRALPGHIPDANRPDLWLRLTRAVEGRTLGFPRAVVEDLAVIARTEPIHAWAAGLGDKLDIYTPNIKFARKVMASVAGLGYDEGFETLDGREPCAASICRLAFQLDHGARDFVIATELGDAPLGPTLEEICTENHWKVIDPFRLVSALDLDDLL